MVSLVGVVNLGSLFSDSRRSFGNDCDFPCVVGEKEVK